MKTIICPVDFSTNSINVAFYATQLAKKINSKIIHVHVFENPVIFTVASISISQELTVSLHEVNYSTALSE